MRKLALFFAAVSLAGCATNPVTGEREFNIVSEQQELQMGAESHPQVLQEYGIYNEKPELNAMVDRIGRRIAAVSDRPNLPWHFTLLDTPIVNAMALPGGYVYVTRGIMERMNSEDELAGVIAHEVSHVAARHAARSISQQQLANLGIGLASIFAGGAATQAYGGLVELGAGLLFTRYSRQQESQADLLGTAYMTEAGYNPRGAQNMLMALERLDTGETSALEQYFIDHPDPRKRVGDVQKEISALQSKNAQIGTGPLDRAFVSSLDNVITGASTELTTVKGNTVYNRPYGIIATAPPGWIATTQPGAVFAFTTPGRSTEGLTVQEVPIQKMQGYASAQGAIRTQLQNMGLRFVNSGVANTRSGQRFDVDLWSGQTDSGQVQVETTQMVEGQNVLVFLQISPASNGRRYDLVSMLQNMQFDRTRARSVEPPRMHVGTSRAGDSWEEIARRSTGHADDAKAIAAINGFDYPSAVPAGIKLKLPEDVIKAQS